MTIFKKGQEINFKKMREEGQHWDCYHNFYGKGEDLIVAWLGKETVEYRTKNEVIV